MGFRWRSPLTIALIVATLPAVWATRGAWSAPFHPTASRTALPTTGAARTPAPTTATPWPRLAQLLAADDFTLGAPRAYGRLDVVGFDHSYDAGISGYKLSATPPSLPQSLPVWKLHGFVDGAATAPLAARLGIHPPATPLPPDATENGRIDPAAATVTAGVGGATTAFTVADHPASDTAALAAASQALVDLGLFPANADAAATPTTDTGTDGWAITYTRRSIGGVSSGFGLWNTEVASMEMDIYGKVTRFDVDAPSVAGGSTYQLRPWRDAWTEVSRGHWFDECCDVNTGGGGPPLSPAFHADKVSVVYEQVAMYLVPMYEFTDTAGKLSLTVPALRLADLAEPGGFRLTQPGAV